MGRQDIGKFSSEHDKRAFTNSLLNDINALDSMLEHKQFKINLMERDTTLIDVKFYDRKSKPLD